MTQSGRSCRNIQRGANREAEPFHVKVRRDHVLIEWGGREVCVVSGREADELKRALEAGDAERVQDLAARKVRRDR